jgi:hypothetical protein
MVATTNEEDLVTSASILDQSFAISIYDQTQFVTRYPSGQLLSLRSISTYSSRLSFIYLPSKQPKFSRFQIQLRLNDISSHCELMRIDFVHIIRKYVNRRSMLCKLLIISSAESLSSIMVLRRVSTFTSNSFPDMMDMAVPLGPFHYASQELDDHQSRNPFEERNSASSSNDYGRTSASTGAEPSFPPWLLEVPPCTSSLTRSSSRSGSEYPPTPPPFIEQPMYNMMDQQLPRSANYMISDPNYISHQELSWQSHLTEGEMCSSQHLLPQPLLLWNVNDYEAPPLPPIEYHVQQLPGNTISSLSQCTTNYQAVGEPPNTAPCTPSDTDSLSTDSDAESDDSEYEDEDSSYSKRKGSGSNSKHTDSKVTPVLNLGKWSLMVDPLSHPPQRLYVCPRLGEPDASGRPCDNSFVRPEHLRRHIKTVHGTDRNYRCKVPQCERAFSRGDNLRDHYWTHIQRGGRAGKNDKMSIPELKAILGHKEKMLMRRLKQRLADLKEKQRKIAEMKEKQKLADMEEKQRLRQNIDHIAF